MRKIFQVVLGGILLLNLLPAYSSQASENQAKDIIQSGEEYSQEYKDYYKDKILLDTSIEDKYMKVEYNSNDVQSKSTESFSRNSDDDYTMVEVTKDEFDRQQLLSSLMVKTRDAIFEDEKSPSYLNLRLVVSKYYDPWYVNPDKTKGNTLYAVTAKYKWIDLPSSTSPGFIGNDILTSSYQDGFSLSDTAPYGYSWRNFYFLNGQEMINYGTEPVHTKASGLGVYTRLEEIGRTPGMITGTRNEGTLYYTLIKNNTSVTAGNVYLNYMDQRKGSYTLKPTFTIPGGGSVVIEGEAPKYVDVAPSPFILVDMK